MKILGISRWLVLFGLLFGSFGICQNQNPCAWEVNHVYSANYNLHEAIRLNLGDETIQRSERQLSGALFMLDLCLHQHLLY